MRVCVLLVTFAVVIIITDNTHLYRRTAKTSHLTVAASVSRLVHIKNDAKIRIIRENTKMNFVAITVPKA